MSLQDFINAHNGQPLEVEDASNLDQCFDLAFGWTDNLGIPRDAIRHLFASQIFTDATDLTRQYFLVIPNSATGVPQPGDLVIFGTGLGRAGHVDIFVSGDAKTFTGFDQNWDTAHYHDGNGNPICRLVLHNYDYGPVLGWLRPKATNQGTTTVATPLTPAQARDFYHIILGREPENDAVLAGRDALEFVYSSQNEATAGRQATVTVAQSMRDQIKAQQDLIDGDTTQIASLSAQVSALTAQLAAAEARPTVSTTTPAPVKHDNFWSTTTGRSVLGVLATLITPAILALQNAQPKDAALAAIVLGAVTVLTTLKDLLNPGLPNTSK